MFWPYIYNYNPATRPLLFSSLLTQVERADHTVLKVGLGEQERNIY